MAAGLRSRHGASNALLRLVAQGRIAPLCTTALFLEYESVLSRPEQRLAHGLDMISVERFLAAFAAAAEPVDIHFRWRPQMTDPADEMVLEAAVNGRAEAIITHNLRDFAGAAKKFGLRIVAPDPALKEARE